MDKPYIKKFSEINGFNVWIVDGYHIRQNIDINFNGFGQHYRFPFIPEREFWIDRQDESNAGEERYFIEHLLVEHQLMAEGKDYGTAIGEADTVEQKLRDEDPKVWELKSKLETDRDSVLNQIHKDFLKDYSNDKVKTYVVHSQTIRNVLYIDWVAGGHDKIYPLFIPKNEIWIDNDIIEEEKKYVLLHELNERYWMSQGLEYNESHELALKKEAEAYKTPEKIEEFIKGEINKQI